MGQNSNWEGVSSQRKEKAAALPSGKMEALPLCTAGKLKKYQKTTTDQNKNKHLTYEKI